MNRGGIFTGPTALGIPEYGIFSGLGAADVGQCVFASATVSLGARAIQEQLIARGATKLKADGIWGPCSESAFIKLTGLPMNRANVENYFGIKCASWVKKGVFDPKKCTSGTDAITPVSTPPTTHPPVEYIETPPKAPPIVYVETPPVTTTQPKTVSKPPSTAVSKPAEWVKGVPNIAIVGAVVAVVGTVAAYVMLKR